MNTSLGMQFRNSTRTHFRVQSSPNNCINWLNTMRYALSAGIPKKIFICILQFLVDEYPDCQSVLLIYCYTCFSFSLISPDPTLLLPKASFHIRLAFASELFSGEWNPVQADTYFYDACASWHDNRKCLVFIFSIGWMKWYLHVWEKVLLQWGGEEGQQGRIVSS